MTSKLTSQFLLDPKLTYLNHGSFGACPQSVIENLGKWQMRMEQDPVQLLDTDISSLLANSRKVLGNFVGCEGDDFVYYLNPTHAFNSFARSIIFI